MAWFACVRRRFLLAALALLTAAPAMAQDGQRSSLGYAIDWSVRIPLRDGVQLNALAYRPRTPDASACLVAITPYGAHRQHPIAARFASSGYTSIVVDSRGRGGSGGAFHPSIQEAHDGYDVIEWLAARAECAGGVAMWGLSYSGAVQWATAKERPPHLTTIIPAASPFYGLDSPMRGGILRLHSARLLATMSGAGSQDTIAFDQSYWGGLYAEHARTGRSFREFAVHAGDRDSIFQEWASHPNLDSYWDAYSPTPQQLAGMNVPILTMTGAYDANQLGALEHYRRHMRYGSASAKARHYLVIGPWDHTGVMMPRAQFGGLEVGSDSLVDILGLHLAWYNWVLGRGPKPSFLRDRVAYYVTGAEEWRYASSLSAVTAQTETLYLDSEGASGLARATGSMLRTRPRGAASDSYAYDPRNTSALEAPGLEPSLVQPSDSPSDGSQRLAYETPAFASAREISGFFRVRAWISIDAPDTAFVASVYEIRPDGRSILLSRDYLRARYRVSDREERLIDTTEPLLYDFDSFTFVSRVVGQASRLRLVIAPAASMELQRSYNSGRPLAEESVADAQTVTVRLHHTARLASTLLVPIGRSATARDRAT